MTDSLLISIAGLRLGERASGSGLALVARVLILQHARRVGSRLRAALLVVRPSLGECAARRRFAPIGGASIIEYVGSRGSSFVACPSLVVVSHFVSSCLLVLITAYASYYKKHAQVSDRQSLLALLLLKPPAPLVKRRWRHMGHQHDHEPLHDMGKGHEGRGEENPGGKDKE